MREPKFIATGLLIFAVTGLEAQQCAALGHTDAGVILSAVNHGIEKISSQKFAYIKLLS